MSYSRICFLPVILLGLSGGMTWAQNNKTPKSSCLVAHFRAVVLDQHDVELRAVQAQDWLGKYSSTCTMEQLASIKANSSSWLGHALTPQLSGVIEGLVEAKAIGKPELMAQLYESLGQAGRPSVETNRTPEPRPRLLSPPVLPMPPVLLVPPVPMNQPMAPTRPPR